MWACSPFGIDVAIIGPGSVATPTWDKAEAAPSDHLAGTVWERPFRVFRDAMIRNGRKGLAPERIGEVVRTALTAATPRTRHAPVPGKLLNWTVPQALPRRVVDRLIGGQLGLSRKRA